MYRILTLVNHTVSCLRAAKEKNFPGGPDGKASVYNAGDPGSIPGLGRSHGEEFTPGLLPGKSHGQRSLLSYSPQGCKELDMTEQLH